MDKVVKTALFSSLLQIIGSTELISVHKDIFKEGLHRDLLTNITFTIQDQNELDLCSWIFIENVTKDTYIYLEEVKGLKDFEFWPHSPIDIEKPTSVSKDHQFIWRLPFSHAIAKNDYVYDVNIRKGSIEDVVEFPLEVQTSVKYEYHLRYQPCGPGKEYTDIEFGGDTRVKLYCKADQFEHTSLNFFSDVWLVHKNNEHFLKTDAPFSEDLLKSKKPAPIKARVPTGDSDKFEEI